MLRKQRGLGRAEGSQLDPATRLGGTKAVLRGTTGLIGVPGGTTGKPRGTGMGGLCAIGGSAGGPVGASVGGRVGVAVVGAAAPR